MEDLKTFGEDDLGHELHSGQTEEVQEADGPEAIAPGGQQPPKALLASSYLVETLCEMGPHSAHN